MQEQNNTETEQHTKLTLKRAGFDIEIGDAKASPNRYTVLSQGNEGGLKDYIILRDNEIPDLIECLEKRFEDKGGVV